MHLYRISDEDKKGYLTLSEMWDLLNCLGIELTQEELMTFLKCLYLDNNIDNGIQIKFSDFMKIFSPVNYNINEKMLDSFIWSQQQAKIANISEEATYLIGLIFELRHKLYLELKHIASKIGYLAKNAILKELTCENSNDDIL
jgi:hypothetical protein